MHICLRKAFPSILQVIISNGMVSGGKCQKWPSGQFSLDGTMRDQMEAEPDADVKSMGPNQWTHMRSDEQMGAPHVIQKSSRLLSLVSAWAGIADSAYHPPEDRCSQL